MEIFQTFAEISIGILGFTAIVIMFRSQHSKWNNNVYKGMIGHCVMALFFSILPFILEAYHCKQPTIWTVGCVLLGSVTSLQGIIVLLTDKESKFSVRMLMFICSSIIGALQFLNVAGILSDQERGPYLIGITWHIFQALVIFSMIVTKKIEDQSQMKD